MYREDIFYGKGKKLDEASAGELAEELQERESENPLAFTDNTHEFQLSKDDIQKVSTEDKTIKEASKARSSNNSPSQSDTKKKKK